MVAWRQRTSSHLAALGRAANELKFSEQVKQDYTKADLSSRERAIADFAVKVSRSPDACSPADIAGLRAEGLSDEDILSLSEIVAYQNMSPRIMESLSTVD